MKYYQKVIRNENDIKVEWSSFREFIKWGHDEGARKGNLAKDYRDCEEQLMVIQAKFDLFIEQNRKAHEILKSNLEHELNELQIGRNQLEERNIFLEKMEEIFSNNGEQSEDSIKNALSVIDKIHMAKYEALKNEERRLRTTLKQVENNEIISTSLDIPDYVDFHNEVLQSNKLRNNLIEYRANGVRLNNQLKKTEQKLYTINNNNTTADSIAKYREQMLEKDLEINEFEDKNIQCRIFINECERKITNLKDDIEDARRQNKNDSETEMKDEINTLRDQIEKYLKSVDYNNISISKFTKGKNELIEKIRNIENFPINIEDTIQKMREELGRNEEEIKKIEEKMKMAKTIEQLETEKKSKIKEAKHILSAKLEKNAESLQLEEEIYNKQRGFIQTNTLTKYEKFIKHLVFNKFISWIFILFLIAPLWVEVVFGKKAFEIFFPDFRAMRVQSDNMLPQGWQYWLALIALVLSMTFIFKYYIERFVMFAYDEEYQWKPKDFKEENEKKTIFLVFRNYLGGLMGFNRKKRPEDSMSNFGWLLLLLVSIALICAFGVTRYYALHDVIEDLDFFTPKGFFVGLMLGSIGFLTPMVSAALFHLGLNGLKIAKKERRFSLEKEKISKGIINNQNKMKNMKNVLKNIVVELDELDKEKSWKTVREAFIDSYETARSSVLGSYSERFAWKVFSDAQKLNKRRSV